MKLTHEKKKNWIMFKKVVLVKDSKQINLDGIYKIKANNNFFCYSLRSLEIQKWYEIVYYRGENGYFYINAAQERNFNQINQNIQNIQQNIFVMSNEVIEIVDENFKISFFLPKYGKYTTHSCVSSCWSGKFCNSCWDLPTKIKEPLELKNRDYFWDDKTNLKKLVHLNARQNLNY